MKALYTFSVSAQLSKSWYKHLKKEKEKKKRRRNGLISTLICMKRENVNRGKSSYLFVHTHVYRLMSQNTDVEESQ